MSNTFDENAIRQKACDYVLAGGEWKTLAGKIGARPNNLSAWARGGPGLVARKKLAKIPAALARIEAQLSKGKQ